MFIGPLVWRPTDGTSSKMHYFMVATSGGGEFHCDQIIMEDEQDREAFIVELTAIGIGAGLVIHNMDDELDMARWCEAMWPGKKITRIRKQLEQERSEA